jgi:hypothetical protein
VCASLDFVGAAILDCEAAEVLAEQPLVSGAASFDAGGTYLVSLVRSGSAEFRLPEACVAPATRSGDCDEFADLLLLRGEHLLELVHCEGSGAACDCLVELRPVEQSLFGYWSAPRGLRVGVDVSPYCVRDDTLSLFTESGTTAGETFGFRRR